MTVMKMMIITTRYRKI